MDQFKVVCNLFHPEMSIPFCIYVCKITNMDTWRERARNRMKEVGMTQEQLAERLDMTPGGAQKWLAGTRQPSLEEINRIAAILGVAPAWLTHGITQDDMLDGLSPEARTTLQRFIRAERREASPHSLWEALNAIADLSLGAESPKDTNDSSDYDRITACIERST